MVRNPMSAPTIQFAFTFHEYILERDHTAALIANAKSHFLGQMFVASVENAHCMLPVYKQLWRVS